MPTWLDAILEIVKITVPALVVFLTVQALLKEYLDRQHRLRQLEYRQKHQDATLPLRLQAYERMSLFCERISIPNLIMRLRSEGMTSAELRMSLLLALQQEYEHNITQQIYISDQLWKILQLARNETVHIISGISEDVEPNSDARVLAQALIQYLDDKGFEILIKAQEAIKKEVSVLF